MIAYSFLLVRYPNVLRRLRDEILSVMGDEVEVTRLQIQRMAYLKCILNESKQFVRWSAVCCTFLMQNRALF